MPRQARLENHAHAVALHYWHFNFARKHATLKTTPAVAAGIASKALTMLDLVELIEAAEIGEGWPGHGLPAGGSFKVNQHPLRDAREARKAN